MTINERKAELIGYRMDEALQTSLHSTKTALQETCLQIELIDSDLPVKIECSCIFCINSIQPGPRQILADGNPRWTLHINRPVYVERVRLCCMCNKRKRFVPTKVDIRPVGRNHLLNCAQKPQQFDFRIEAMLLDRLAPSPKRPRSARGIPSDSAVSYEAQSSTTQICSTSRSTRPARGQHFYRDLNLIKIEDMDWVTRRERLRALKRIIKRGDELTEVEKAQLADLEAKGTGARGRDLSRINVADMESRTRKMRRGVLRKKVHRYHVLNEAEMKQLKDFGMKNRK